MKKQDLINILGELGFPLFVTEEKRITGEKIEEVLENLVSSDDARLIEGFPVVIANVGHRGIDVDFKALLSRQTSQPVQRNDLEKLLLLSFQLLSQEGIKPPESLYGTVEPLERQYGNLLAEETLSLERGLSLSVERMRNTLKRYAAKISDTLSAREEEKLRQKQSFQFHKALSTLFSPKQKELVLKKLEGKTFTKTEQEYYSRVVKKKLEAIANEELVEIAVRLTKKI
jgi:hypothetical protein